MEGVKKLFNNACRRAWFASTGLAMVVAPGAAFAVDDAGSMAAHMTDQLSDIGALVWVAFIVAGVFAAGFFHVRQLAGPGRQDGGG